MKNDSARNRVQDRLALWATLYALAIIYCSVVVGPTGFNFVSMDVGQAWQRFLEMPYFINGSDQRADWMANLLMFVPLGFLITGILDPHRGIVLRSAISLLALASCIIFLLAVKFLQLFFPGRTVSLNYVTAQSLGSFIGVLLFWLAHAKIPRGKTTDARQIVIGLLALYAMAYPIFMLLPLNFTLSANDLHDRLLGVRNILLSWPGFGRPAIIRLALVVANFLAAVPLGLLLAIKTKDRSLAWYLGVSVIVMALITGLKVFVISGTPYLVGIAYTSAGMLVGVCLVRWVRPKAIMTIRAGLLRALPLLIPLYVVAVLDVNGLISRHWRTFEEALASLDPRALLPFWNWYIVSKAQAIESQAVHAIMFLPIGIMLSLRGGITRRDVWIAAILAFLFALSVEVGRWFRPGLAPDFYEAVTAALAAGLSVKLMQAIWAISEGEQIDGARPDGGQNPGLPGKTRLRNYTVRP